LRWIVALGLLAGGIGTAFNGRHKRLDPVTRLILFGEDLFRNGEVKSLGGVLKTAIMRRLRGEEGQTLVEYALIILLVAVALVAALTTFGGGLSGAYSTHNLEPCSCIIG